MRNKRIDHISNIMSKRYGIVAENITIFLSNARKLETCRDSNLTNFSKSSLGDDISVTFVS